MTKLLILIIVGSVLLLIFMGRGSSIESEEAYAKSVPENWFVDWEKSLERSVQDNKPIFAVFSGSDWCPPCQKLSKDVFESAEWSNYAKDAVVFFYLDFPRKKELPNRFKKQNNELAVKYEINSFPSCLLLNAKGEVLQRIYYRFDEPGAFIKKVQEALAEKG